MNRICRSLIHYCTLIQTSRNLTQSMDKDKASHSLIQTTYSLFQTIHSLFQTMHSLIKSIRSLKYSL